MLFPTSDAIRSICLFPGGNHTILCNWSIANQQRLLIEWSVENVGREGYEMSTLSNQTF